MVYTRNSPLTKFDLYGLYGLCQDDDFNLDAQLATGRFFGEFITELAYAEFEGVVGVGRLVCSATSFGRDFVANPSEVTQTVYTSASEKWDAIQSTTWNDVFQAAGDAVHSAVEHVVDKPASALAHAVANFTNPWGALGNTGRGAKVLTVLEREQKVAQNGAKIVKEVRGSGRSKNKLKPNPDAQGAHTVFKRDQTTGNITHYETFIPNPNLREHDKWKSVSKYHSTGKDPRGHFSKETNSYSGYPHIHDTHENNEKVRAPFLSEIPK